MDFESNTITIDRTLIEIRGKATLGETTKTFSGDRNIPMTTKVKFLLYKIYQNQNHGLNKLNLAFPTKNYTLKNTYNVRRKFKATCIYAEIPNINIHILRHTFATRMLESEVNIKVLSEILGHKNINITLDTYAHVLPDFKKENMLKIDEFL